MAQAHSPCTSMMDQEFAEILALGYERRGTEFKGRGPRSTQPLFEKVVRAVFSSMANQQDDGLVVIGGRGTR